MGVRGGGPEVLDASVVVEWFAPRDVQTGELAAAILRRVADGPRGFVVPALLFHEVHAVLCRKLGSAGDVARALDHVWRLGLATVAWDQEMAGRAAAVAFAHGLSGYDATYVAVAELVQGVWLTFDEKAAARVAQLGLSRVPAGA